jgi:hypothetical protein
MRHIAPSDRTEDALGYSTNSESLRFDARFRSIIIYWRTGIACSGERLDTVWTVRGLNPEGKDVFRTHPD